MPVRAVVLDVGETVLDRSREYASWALFFEVPAHTFSAVFGAIVAQGGSVSDVLRFFAARQSGGPAADVDLRQLRAARGEGPPVSEVDLYPDVRGCLTELRRQGLRVAVCGNQAEPVGAQLRGLHLDADLVASSGEWAISKPDRAYFDRLAAALAVPPGDIVHVGDQLGNDITAALDSAWQAVRIRRGPWGLLTSDAEIEARCLAVITSLDQLAPLLG